MHRILLKTSSIPQPGSPQAVQANPSCSEVLVTYADILNQSVASILLSQWLRCLKNSVKTIKYATLQNNPLFLMAPLFPNNTVPPV